VRYKILIYPNNLFFLYLHLSNVTLLFRRPLPLWRLRRRDKIPASLDETNSWGRLARYSTQLTLYNQNPHLALATPRQDASLTQ
jgi:hypothetical protein